MIPTEKEKEKQAALIEARRERARQYAAVDNRGTTNNPMYGTDPFEPSSYLPRLPSNPALSKPLPSGRFIDPQIPSGASIGRAAEIKAFRDQPKDYINSNIAELNNEQSLIDKGMGMMGRIFNYRDESDLELFNVKLGTVESVFDGFLKYYTGAFDLLNIGFGGLLSAAPGGTQTLSYNQLSGGKSVGQVLNGEMEPGTAPSPGQIALTSIGIEAKRIREGNARLSDILLVNPATGPFILAALAAESSPLQKDGFNIMDQEQRDNAFTQGFEQWMSGVTDAGLMFADPLVAVGVGAKILRAGALGSPGTVKSAQDLGGALNNAVDALDPKYNIQMNELINIGAARKQAEETPNGIAKRIIDDPEYMPTDFVQSVTFKDTDPIPEYKNPLATFLHKLHQVKEDGSRKMTADEISRDPSFQGLTEPSTVGDLLSKSRSPAESSLILQALAGTPGAQQKMVLMDAGVGDVIFRYRREVLAAKSAWTEPQKVKEVSDNLEKQIANTREAIKGVKEQSRGVKKTEATGESIVAGQNINSRLMTLQQNLDELVELKAVFVDGKQIDYLDPTNPFYRQDLADQIMVSLLGTKDAYGTMLRANLFDAALTTKTFLPSTNNAYSRMVMQSRGRRQAARYQYAAEKTSIFPRKIVTESVDGKVVRQSDGWFTKSEFEETHGTSRLQRNIRVWRWMGAETPNGYIGLKGTATVGSEREFTAALDLDLYQGAGVQVTRDVVNKVTGEVQFESVKGADGVERLQVKRETITVGGINARQNYYSRFYEALNNPDMDAKQVLDRIELDVMEDFGKVYNLDQEALENLWATANKFRAQNLELIRKRGYFVDPVSGAIQLIPYLDSQLANGTYMQNFGDLEKTLKREIAKDNGERLRVALTLPMEAAGSAYNLFNNFWRPLTLMRLSYTQRNILEGTFRAMAYSASVAPLLWPVKGTIFGIRNAVVTRAVGRRATVAAKKIESSEYGRYLQELNEAVVDEYYFRSAIKKVDSNSSEPMVVVFGKDRSIREMTEAQYEASFEAVTDRVTNAQAALKDNVSAFDAAVKGTAFGTWRRKNIDDLEASLGEVESINEGLMETARDLFEDMGLQSIDDPLLEKLGEVIRSKQKIQSDLVALQYEPTKAMSMYRTQAGRQRRIGSGRSMGPGGNYYNDAFTGPYEQINRNLMSADATVTQQLSLTADIWSSLFFKTQIRANTAVKYTPGTEKQWVAGLSDAIEEASSSWVVRSLVNNKWDEVEVLNDMTSTDDGRVFLTRIMPQMGEGNLEAIASTVRDAYVGKKPSDGVDVGDRFKVKGFAVADRSASGQSQVTVTDLDQARIYVNEVANQVKGQMQNRQEFMALLERRVGDKNRGADDAQKITPEMVEDALNLIPSDQKNSLGFIQGATVVRMGSDGFLRFWAKSTARIFRVLGTIPEDAITRGGFYNQQYKASRNILLQNYLVNSGQGAAIKNKTARGSTNAEQGNTVAHDAFDIPASEMSRIEVQSHRQALKDTREWMYTIERRTNVGKYGEWIFPFISATQNSATVVGKLLYKEPWLAPMVADLWRMPSRLGIEDEEGNIQIPMPLEWVRKYLQDNPNIPFLGGVVDSADVLRIPKDAFNLFMPETGFGIAPRATPWVQVGASELMKVNAFPIETPQVFKSVFGDETGDEYYSLLKDYIFGEEQGASSNILSYDKLTPAYIQKIVQSKDELSAQYGYQYALHYHTQTMRWRANERDKPTESEIAKRTTNSFWFAALGNWGAPTPLTPYPIITRPQVDSPVSLLQEVYQRLQSANPLTANMNMDRMFGDFGLEAALTKVTQNVGGANPTPETVSDINTLSPLVRSLAPDIGASDLSVLGILVNNRRAPAAYEQSAYNWQKAALIPGTNREWREVQSPEEAVAERQRLTGWTLYRQAIDQLDAQMKSAGLTSYELIAAAPYKKAKERLVDNLLSNPDYAGWIVDFQDRGGSKTQSAVRVMEGAVADTGFRELLIKNGKERLLSIMEEYTSTRRLLNSVLQNSGHGIDHDSNLQWKIGWDALRLKWRGEDERWAEIDSLYLSGDANPQSPGDLYLQEMATQQMQGAK